MEKNPPNLQKKPNESKEGSNKTEGPKKVSKSNSKAAREVLSDEVKRMKELFADKFADKSKNPDTQQNMFKFMTMLRLFSTMKILSEDAEPVEIIEHLYIGSIGASSNEEALKKCKITHIVIAAVGLKQYFPEQIKYLQFNFLDSETEDIKSSFDECGKFIHDAIQSGGNVMVHCHAGISRSSSLILAYLIKYQKMTFEEALELAKSKRDIINPNPGFAKQLKEYELELNQK